MDVAAAAWANTVPQFRRVLDEILNAQKMFTGSFELMRRMDDQRRTKNEQVVELKRLEDRALTVLAWNDQTNFVRAPQQIGPFSKCFFQHPRLPLIQEQANRRGELDNVGTGTSDLLCRKMQEPRPLRALPYGG
jgi:hypothetical protein